MTILIYHIDNFGIYLLSNAVYEGVSIPLGYFFKFHQYIF
jgi:hypothetical protein